MQIQHFLNVALNADLAISLVVLMAREESAALNQPMFLWHAYLRHLSEGLALNQGVHLLRSPRESLMCIARLSKNRLISCISSEQHNVVALF